MQNEGRRNEKWWRIKDDDFNLLKGFDYKWRNRQISEWTFLNVELATENIQNKWSNQRTFWDIFQQFCSWMMFVHLIKIDIVRKIGNMFKILKRTGFPFKYSTEVLSLSLLCLNIVYKIRIYDKMFLQNCAIFFWVSDKSQVICVLFLATFLLGVKHHILEK